MILYDLCSSHGGDSWKEAARAQGMNLRSYSWGDLTQAGQREAVLRELAAVGADGQEPAAVLFSDQGMDLDIETMFLAMPDTLPLLPVGSDALLLRRGNVDGAHIGKINEYVTYGGEDNIRAMMAYIRRYIFGDEAAGEIPDVIKTAFDGIYSVDAAQADEIYTTIDEFLAAEGKTYDHYVGILTHRSSWLTHAIETETALTHALHRLGVGVIPVFSSGEKGETVRSYDFNEVIEHYFSRNGTLFIEALINLQVHLIKGENGLSAAEHAAELFSDLQIPIFHPVTSYNSDRKQWEESANPLAQEIQFAYLQEEMQGMIEPVLVGVRDPQHKGAEVLAENVEWLARRIQKWVQLRTKPNGEKKVVLMLHNAVCSGVEATIGLAFGLDPFESVVHIMHRLEREGYRVENIPENGEALRKLILGKKAISDFRWTHAEDIVQSGGCLYRMPVHDEYLGYFREFTPSMQADMLQQWGEPPGEGMVLGDDLLVTGLSFGHLTVMVQPKRGCYGAKCTGEVCRILHDPTCPPAHQYIATYRYIERVLGADAIIHFGTEGSLEYLPGKASGLSTACWPYAVLGSMPNLYPYHVGVISEGTVAKRRSQAVTFGYYPAASGGLDADDVQLMDRLDAYGEAWQMHNGQESDLQKEVEEALHGRKALEKLLGSADSFYDGVQLVRASLLRGAEGRKISRRHIFGENPDREEAVRYICEMLIGDGILEKNRETGQAENAFAEQADLYAYVEAVLEGKTENNGAVEEDIRRTYAKLMQTKEEETFLLRALDGGYILPGEGGMPDENGRKILPAGRNFYMMNMDKIPSRTAYERGKILAEQLIEAYRADEGRIPQKVAMNMISIDVGRTHGEQLSQFLYLLGIRPVWDRLERVIGLEPLPVQELGRPRIDVTLRISGVMRDTWPDAVSLMDEAVMLAASLEETDAENFVLANIHDMERECGELGERARTIRIFGDPPGAYGAGVDLALKASAWDSEKDLARYFIQSSAFAYGKGLHGRKSIREFVQNVKRIDLTTDVTSSRRMDTLACGFGLEVQGGFKMLAETFGRKKIRQYQSVSELHTPAKTSTLAEQVERDIEETLLNASWQDSKTADGYTGASDMMHRMQNVFEAQCVNDCVRDETLDRLTEAYVNDEEMRTWLLEANPYAAEEIARRLLELESRGKWHPEEDLLAALQENYLTIEGVMEGESSGRGEIQGGSVEIIRDTEVENWRKNLADIDAYLHTIEDKDSRNE